MASEDYYPEAQTDTAAEGADNESPKSDKGEEYGGESALIPKALLAGKEFKPGEEVVFKIVHMYEDEVEIEYATDDKKDTKKSNMDMAMDGMDAMATKEG
jgi:hypothetical protein